MNKFELEERLIDFAVLIIEIVNKLPNTKAGNHLAGQLVRSGTSLYCVEFHLSKENSSFNTGISERF